MPYNTFPAFAGIGWDIKKRIIFSTATETASSGAEFRSGRWSLPHYEFTLQFNYLSQANRDTLEAFVIGQRGSLTPFLLSVTNDSTQTTAACTGTADGSNKLFQMPLPAQAQFVSGSVFDNGATAGANTVSASGLITFTTAPAAGHAITWTGSYAYLVRFKDDMQEINQIVSQMYEQKSVLFRTVR
jgi:hypothetical protein